MLLQKVHFFAAKIKRLFILLFNFFYNWLLNYKTQWYSEPFDVEVLIENDSVLDYPSCLCSIQLKICKNAIPETLGYLFHNYPNSDGSLYFKQKMSDDVKKIVKVDFNVLEYNFAISPSGIIIASLISQRGVLYVIKDGIVVTLFEKQKRKPCGWLYNSGVDFIIDQSGVECCVFAEYAHDSDVGFFVWKGIAPYTDEKNWKIVFHQQSETDIHHFHQLKRDPWTNVLYLTSGDEGYQNKWWYSDDCGESFKLINSDKMCHWPPNTLRTINFIFTKDFIYWATDSGSCHSLNRIERQPSNGLMDISTKKCLTNLPYGQATNMICYIPERDSLFLYERIAWSYDFYKLHKQGFYVYLWSIEKNCLYRLLKLKIEDENWGGHRGKCYQSYGTKENCVMMGFSRETPCIISSYGEKYKLVGTVKYNF